MQKYEIKSLDFFNISGCTKMDYSVCTARARRIESKVCSLQCKQIGEPARRFVVTSLVSML